jgi:hypothetical protein
MKSKIFDIQRTKKRVCWTKNEDELLITHSLKQSRRSWTKISKLIRTKTPYECFLRFRSINPYLKKGSWDNEEDEHIVEGVKKYGPKWYIIAKGFSNRNAKQIRDRYINYLDPSIVKSKFSLEEDLMILDLHNRYGNKWSIIRHYMPHRSADMIKNRYNSSVKRNKKLVDLNKCNCSFLNTEYTRLSELSFSDNNMFSLDIPADNFDINDLFNY